MRPDALRGSNAGSPLRAELAEYLRLSGSHLALAEAAALAVRAWIAADRAAAHDHVPDRAAAHDNALNRDAPTAAKSPLLPKAAASAAPHASQSSPPSAQTAGYLWKTVFLPHGTQLRMDHGGRTYTAQVIGNEIVFEGARVSPRGMMMAVTGKGRNAWRDMVLKFPHERFWKRANRARYDVAFDMANGAPCFPYPHQRAYKCLHQAVSPFAWVSCLRRKKTATEVAVP
ncbi:MAG TPA: hypothetical protein VGC21_07995 [Telluria sp.]|jgi:hypothetical protein